LGGITQVLQTSIGFYEKTIFVFRLYGRFLIQVSYTTLIDNSILFIMNGHYNLAILNNKKGQLFIALFLWLLWIFYAETWI